MINKNKLFRQIHIYVSLFFLPLALLYAFSGLLFLLGADENTGLKKQEFIVQASLSDDKDEQRAFLLNFLKEHKLKLPNNTKGLSYEPNDEEAGLSLGTAYYSVNLQSLDDERIKISTYERSFIGSLTMLHENQVPPYFFILGIAFAISMFVLYISGLMISFFAMKKDRAKQIYTVCFSLLLSLILGYFSLAY